LGYSILNVEIRDGGIDYQDVHLFQLMGSNADLPAASWSLQPESSKKSSGV
jgi:hypothetical protein